ncbi:3092_t:CDS:2 [Dentiscutata heterogama]|uniref:3092_t:CDS:1 n=1 Tax=Dentiscutata heterogama TaxID=1316150 RepID=A0ACA9LRC5_9GLOM|nr:3092_t:CDS:2 [Dentiscutata heterogama]
MCESDSSINGSTDQDLLMCESSIDDTLTMINNKLSTAQPSTVKLSKFEAQIQAMFINNNAMNSSSSQSGNLSLNKFQYSVPSSNMLSLGSSKSFLYSSNSTSLDASNQNSNLDDFNSSEYLYYSPNASESSIEDIGSLDTFSPLTQDSNVSSTNSTLADFSSHSSSMKDTFDTYNTLFRPGSNIDPLGIQSENGRKRASIKCDSTSSDESLKKRRKAENVTVKSVKKTSIYYKSTKKIDPFIKYEADSESSLTPNMHSKSPVIDLNTMNRTTKPFDTNSVQGKHSDKNTSFGTKLPIPRLKHLTSTFQPQPSSQTLTNKQQKRTAHNVIERRYRNNINERINDLKNVIPAQDDDVIEEVVGIPPRTKINKATVLKKATEYIKHLKMDNHKFKSENDDLKKIIATIPGGTELYNSYFKVENELTPLNTPLSEIDSLPTPSSGNGASRILMTLFMCIVFFVNPTKYVQLVPHHHSDEGRVIVSNNLNNTELSVQNEIYNSQSDIVIDIWIFAFLMCFTYIVWPSLYSIKEQQTRKSAIISCLTSKTKDVTELYSSLSSLSNCSSMNTFGYATSLFIETLKLFLKFLGWEIPCAYFNVDMDERLLEVELWNRLGEAELCGGNKRATCLSVLYTCLRTINLLESPYTYNKSMRISPSRIYANAALQCYVGLQSVPSLSHRAVSYFWKLAIKEKGRSNSEEKWLEIALINDHNNDILEIVANRIRDHVFHLSENEEIIKPKICTTVPLVYVSEVQALFHFKEAFANLISVRHSVNKVQKKKSKFTFSELLGITTPASLMHWYALVGCIVQAFYEGENDLGAKLVNKLNEESKANDDLSKQIITMSLLSRYLLICDKIEASIHYADKVVDYVSLRKNKKIETTEVDKLVIREIVKDIDNLVEICVGWIVLETRIVILGIVGNLQSKNKDKILPNVLDESYIRSSINVWARYLRRLSKLNVFDNIPNLREKFIRQLEAVGRIISGIDEEIDPVCDCGDYDKQNNNEYKATRALCTLKDM